MNKIKKILFLIIMMIIGLNRVKGLTEFYPEKLLVSEDISEKDPGYYFSPKFGKSYKLSNALKNWNNGKCGDYKTKFSKRLHGCSNTSSNDDFANITKKNVDSLIEQDLSITYYKVGYYYNSSGVQIPVDMKIQLVAIEWGKDANVGSFGFKLTHIGLENASKDNVLKNNHRFIRDDDSGIEQANFIYEITYFNSNTKKQLDDNFKSIINFTDMDLNEMLKIRKSDVYKTYRLDTQNYIGKEINHIYGEQDEIYYYLKTNDKLVLDCVNQADHREVNCDGKGGIKKSYLEYSKRTTLSENDLSNIELKDFYKNAGTATVLFKGSKIRFGWAGYYTSLQDTPFTKLSETNPKKNVWHNIDFNEKTFVIGKDDNYITYTFDLSVPNQSKTWWYSEWTIEDKIPEELELINKTDIYKSVSVKNKSTGADVTWMFKSFNFKNGKCTSKTNNCNNGSISIDNNTLMLKAGSYYLQKDNNNFYGNTYVVTVKMKLTDKIINSNLQDITNKKIENYISHTYKFSEGGATLKSNTVWFSLDKKDTSSTDCPTLLSEIKNSNDDNNVKILKLYNLFNNEYSKGNNYTGILNYSYDIISDKLNLDNVSCSDLSSGCEEETVVDSKFNGTYDSSKRNLLSCSGNNEINSGKPSNSSNTSNTVCYAGRENNNFGSYYDSNLDAFCSISFNYKYPFNNESVISGQLLWRNRIGRKIGDMSVSVTCENVYEEKNKEKILNENRLNLDPNLFLPNVLPDMGITWQYSKLSNKFEKLLYDYETVKLIKPNDSSDNMLKPTYKCTKNGENDICYVKWDGVFDIKINYETDWFADSSGKYYKSNDNDYIYAGSGLPIILLDDELKTNLQSERDATLTISNALPGNTYSVYCDYTVVNKHFNPDLNVQFRTIDISNPFPGLNGEGRYTGSNWCSSAYIGTLKYDYDSGEAYVVGDTHTQDGVITSAEFQASESQFHDGNKIIFDIDGDENITYDSNCSSIPRSDDEMKDVADNCILLRYATSKSDGTSNNIYNCTSDNNIVKRVITNSQNSYSTSKPMYSFTLSSSDINLIRKYNKFNAYNDFNFDCEGNGDRCKSDFITSLLDKKIIFDGREYSIDLDINQDNSRCYGTRLSVGGHSWCNPKTGLNK